MESNHPVSKAVVLLNKLKQFSTINSRETMKIIDELNALYSLTILGDSKEIEDLISELLKLTLPENNTALSKLSYLLSHILSTEKFHHHTFNESMLLNLLIDENVLDATKYNATYILYNLLRNEKFPKVSFSICGEKCLHLLKLVVQGFFYSSDILKTKVLVNTLKCLQLVFSDKMNKWKNIGEVLGILKILIFFGLPGQSAVTDTNLFPSLQCPGHLDSQSESDTPYPKIRKKKRKDKRTVPKRLTSNDDDDEGATASPTSKFLRNDVIPSCSSESEVSDAENSGNKLKKLQSSIRENAYVTLTLFVQLLDKRLMFGYWSSFLPEYSVMPGYRSSPTVFTTILKDPSSQVRLSAFAFLEEILNGSKPFLVHADGRNVKQMSFTALSSILATMISEIHRCLLLALLSENSTILLTQILKSYAVLCVNVPYVKLPNDILFNFLKPLKNFLSFKDPQVQVSASVVFGALISSDQMPLEFEAFMLSPDGDKQSVVPKPWLFELCQRNLRADGSRPVQIQSLQLLGCLVGRYFNKSEGFLPELNQIIITGLGDSHSALQLHAAKVLDVVGRCASNSVEKEELQRLNPIVSELWCSVLSGPLMKCLCTDDNKSLQSVCCDCLSSLPFNEFNNLPERQQLSFVTILLGLAVDPNPNLRGAAIRCLGLFFSFPSLTQDPSFVDDVSRILVESVRDPNGAVRFKASWSLGNLSDALFGNRELNAVLTFELFHSLGKACIEYSKDGDRVRANAVRALGNFLKFLPQQFIGLPMIQDFVKKSCDVLKSSLLASLMKVRWNACYAFGNLLKNLPLFSEDIVDVADLLTALLQALKSPNFKVRISAAQALTSLTSRSSYSGLFVIVWRQLISACLSTSSDVNFREIKHQENLSDQLCFSLIQLSALLTLDDIPLISEAVLEARDWLLVAMWNFGSRTSAEKNNSICSATDRLIALKNENNSLEVNSFITMTLDVLNQAVIAFYEFNEN